MAPTREHNPKLSGCKLLLLPLAISITGVRLLFLRCLRRRGSPPIIQSRKVGREAVGTKILEVQKKPISTQSERGLRKKQKRGVAGKGDIPSAFQMLLES